MGTNIGTVTVTQSGGTTFSSTVDAVAVTLTDTTGTIQFDGALTATDLNAARGIRRIFVGWILDPARTRQPS